MIELVVLVWLFLLTGILLGTIFCWTGYQVLRTPDKSTVAKVSGAIVFALGAAMLCWSVGWVFHL